MNVLSLSGPSSKTSTPPVAGVTDKASLCGEKRVLVYSLPDELETDEEIHAKAGGDDCLKSLLLYKRDVELISSIHLHRLNDVKNKRNDSIRHSNDEGSPILSQTQLTDHDFDLIDKAVAQFSKMNDLIKKMPSFDIFQEVQDFDVVQEDGGSIGDLETMVTNINIVEETHDKACDDVEIIDCIFKEYKCVVTTGSTFNIKIVPFHWKTPIRNTRNTDSSLFLMLHMFFFKGENFQSDFNEYLRRRLYKFAIGAAIILHPLNTCRLNILQKVEEFNPEKNKRLNDER
ncbi:unnamed protein product [Amaranthus hypochondriacus]